jgi:hypothetical protein
MATSTRTKTPPRSNKKGGRRLPPKVKSRSDIPVMPVAVGVILVLVAIALIVWTVRSNNSSQPATAAGIPCDKGEHTEVHYHAALQIIYLGNPAHLPANLGIDGDPSTPTCFYWLHVHAGNQDTIHIESPASRTFTLGDFFAVWNAWAIGNGLPPVPLDAHHVATFTLTADQTLVIYVDKGDGKGPQLYAGDPKKIVLTAHEVVTLEITPPTVTPPPFTFASGL